MKRIWVLSVILLAVGAVEFGLLGAGSAGASFLPGWLASKGGASAARDHRPTPTTTPVSPPSSPPPCHPDREHGHDSACAGDPASIQLTPDPLVIHCDGSDHSTLTVRITDARGRPVADGTFVSFFAYDGNTTPPFAQTHGGVASTSITFYGDIFPQGPNVVVDAVPLEAGVRIRCFPESNRPPSPPPCTPSSPPSVSPPCATPTPQSPPCSSSPKSSPPCPTLTPTWTPIPFPTDTPTPGPSTGGQISFGTPSLVTGAIRVPVLTSAAPDPYTAFSVHVRFDGALLSMTGSQIGDALLNLGGGFFCVPTIFDDGGYGATVACTALGGAETTSAGTLITLIFTPKSATGCSPFHLFTYGPPDLGDVGTGTFTMTTRAVVQLNTYGPDITVNLADGTTGCAAPPLPTSTPTPIPTIPTPWSPPVGTSTATPTATRTPLTMRTLTATPTSSGGIVPIEICVPLPGSPCPTSTPTPGIPVG